MGIAFVENQIQQYTCIICISDYMNYYFISFYTFGLYHLNQRHLCSSPVKYIGIAFVDSQFKQYHTIAKCVLWVTSPSFICLILYI